MTEPDVCSEYLKGFIMLNILTEHLLGFQNRYPNFMALFNFTHIGPISLQMYRHSTPVSLFKEILVE